MTCPYCNGDISLVTGRTIYPHLPNLYHLKFWQCAPCNAYVGCHKGTTKALGTLANSELREVRKLAHKNFDPLWQLGFFKSRTKAYRWLANTLNIEKSKCHIAMFNIEQCKTVIKLTRELTNNKEYHDR